MKLLSLLFLFLLFSTRVSGQTMDCQTFTSIDGKTISVDNIYGGYYLIGYAIGDSQASESVSITVSGARESPDGGSDFHLSYSLPDLPAQLPTGTVNGIQFELSDATASPSHFSVMLGSTPDACSSVATPASGSTVTDQDKSPRMFATLVIIVLLIILAMVWFLGRRSVS
jgi:hypothetical protein